MCTCAQNVNMMRTMHLYKDSDRIVKFLLYVIVLRQKSLPKTLSPRIKYKRLLL